MDVLNIIVHTDMDSEQAVNQIEGNREDTCELIIEGHEFYCPDIQMIQPALTFCIMLLTKKSQQKFVILLVDVFKESRKSRKILSQL